MRALSCSISLTPNTVNNGPLLVIPGSHKHFLACVGETPENHYKQSLRRQEYGVPDDTGLTRMVEDGGIEACTGGAGMVTFFDCNIMHGSNSNITPMPRSNVFIVFNSVENALVDPFCGLSPRPQFIANRRDFAPIKPG
jgi:ectoine hydroxylase